MYSLTIREIYRRFHGVDVGLYTLGPCEVEPGGLAPGTSVGRYSSIYWTSRAIAHDSQFSTRFPGGIVPGPALGEKAADCARGARLVIGNDVFVGHNAIILPSVEEIGDGAFIGAGSVVHANVPPYAVVTGNPARAVRYRFPPEKIKELIESRWWMKTIDELTDEIGEFQKPLDGSAVIR